MAQALGGKLAGGVAGKPQSVGNRWAEQRIAEGAQDQGERAFGNLMFFMANAQLRDECSKRIEDRIEGVAVAGEDHPGGERASAFAVENIECAIDDIASVGFTSAGAFDRFGDTRPYGFGERTGKLTLELGCRPKMMKNVRVRSADFGGDSLQCNRLRAVRDKQLPSGFNCGRSAFLWAQSFPSC